MTNLESPQGTPERGPAGTPETPLEATQRQTPPVEEPTRPRYQAGTTRYPDFDSPGTVYRALRTNGATESPRPPTDWATRDRQGPGRTEFIDPDAPVRGRHPVINERDHFLDTEQRLAVGDEYDYYDYRQEPEERVRVSWLAVSGLVLGVIGILTAPTGVLAPVAMLCGAVGLLSAIGGLVATRRHHVASRSLATFGFLVSGGALMLGGLATYGDYGWLNRDDQASWLRDWLNARFPWLESW